MSIRLRLTLLYSAILTITLIVFSAALYVTQTQATFAAVKATLARQAENYVNTERRFPRASENPSFGNMIPGRWTQLRSVDGTVSARTADLADTTLPLSDAGLRAAQGGSPWIEVAQVENEPLLIYTQPAIAESRVIRIVQVAAPIAEREQALNTLRFILIVASGLTILAAFVIGWALAGMALRPIHQITHTAQAIGAERDFSRRVQHTGPNDEIGQLAVTFNTMLTKLETAYRQVEQALQAQRRFVADASHELRTPLTTLRGNIELLRHEPPIDAKEQADVLADTKDEAERLIRLVNQLLVLARADAGRLVRREALPIKPLLEDACRQARLLAPHRTITCDAPVDTLVLGDRDALKQVLLILLDNARVHTPSSATINVTTQVADHRVAIQIRDTGRGIAPDLLPHIFERFYRGDVSRSGGGMGLGLSIAKELIEAQGGTVTVESQVGQGSVFTLTLAQTVE
ncbi:two-component system, OmpR family, sensor kinase [Anaerolineae bacterium]|nr:two-component system, OmpR family, sensor kinase [Anaerolineae bacterium]